MKQIDVSLWELRPDEVIQLPRGTQILQMDVQFGGYAIKSVRDDVIPLNIARFKFFAFEEPKL